MLLSSLSATYQRANTSSMATAALLREEKARFSLEVSSPDLSRFSDDDDDFWDDAGAAGRLGAAAERIAAVELSSGRAGVTPVIVSSAHGRAPDAAGAPAEKVELGGPGAAAARTPLSLPTTRSDALLGAMRRIIEDCDHLYRQTAIDGERAFYAVALSTRVCEKRFCIFFCSDVQQPAIPSCLRCWPPLLLRWHS